jgi:hypothetical protein
MFTLIAYKPEHNDDRYRDSCAGDFQFHNYLSRAELVGKLASYIYGGAKSGSRYNKYGYIILNDGIKVYDTIEGSGAGWDGYCDPRMNEEEFNFTVESDKSDAEMKAIFEEAQIASDTKIECEKQAELAKKQKAEADAAERRRKEHESPEAVARRKAEYEKLKNEFEK